MPCRITISFGMPSAGCMALQSLRHWSGTLLIAIKHFQHLHFCKMQIPPSFTKRLCESKHTNHWFGWRMKTHFSEHFCVWLSSASLSTSCIHLWHGNVTTLFWQNFHHWFECYTLKILLSWTHWGVSKIWWPLCVSWAAVLWHCKTFWKEAWLTHHESEWACIYLSNLN